VANLLTGKVALITGGAGGIGAATARLFVQEGANIVLCDFNEELGSQVAREVGGDFIKLDVRDEDGWRVVVDTMSAKFDGPDILVNSCGIFEVASIAETTLEMFERTMQINVLGTFLAIRECAPLMAKKGGGSIVNLSSAAGLIGTPGTAAYSSSKWAVRGITKVAALELANSGVRVNSIHPGGIDTDMTRFIKGNPGALGAPSAPPIARKGQPEEVARMALFLASEQSSYSTGAEFVCDGGLTAR